MSVCMYISVRTEHYFPPPHGVYAFFFGREENWREMCRPVLTGNRTFLLLVEIGWKKKNAAVWSSRLKIQKLVTPENLNNSASFAGVRRRQR